LSSAEERKITKEWDFKGRVAWSAHKSSQPTTSSIGYPGTRGISSRPMPRGPEVGRIIGRVLVMVQLRDGVRVNQDFGKVLQFRWRLPGWISFQCNARRHVVPSRSPRRHLVPFLPCRLLAMVSTMDGLSLMCHVCVLMMAINKGKHIVRFLNGRYHLQGVVMYVFGRQI
jgi:hypothetical protein